MPNSDVCSRLLGFGYRSARRLGLITRAARQQDVWSGVVRPVGDAPLAVREGSGRPLRVLLFGNGPAESLGVNRHADGFGARIADSVAIRTGRPVRLVTIAGSAFHLPELAEQLHAARTHWCDAVVAVGSYRPALAEVPLEDWRHYMDLLRGTLMTAADPDCVVQFLSLPWRDAAQRASVLWGGAFGARVASLDAAAQSVLDPYPDALRLVLSPPARASEWIGPAFSRATYTTWGIQVADQLQSHLLRTGQH